MTIGENSFNVSGFGEMNSANQFDKMKVGGRPPKADFNQMLNQMTSDLNLTDDQKSKVSSILKENMQKMEETRENDMTSGKIPSRDEMKAKMDDNLSNLRSELQSILSTEQMDKFTSIINSRKNETHQDFNNSYNPDGNFSVLV